jgi:coproporphyrinogen III oxidase-like Fe-S oxidoreductase
VHVPFCASRCAYCDFNTYTAAELRGRDARAGFAADAIAEVDLAARTLSGERPLVSTVFFGGGTPTLLPAVDLVRILRAVDERLGLVPGAEVTVEANPESVDPAVLALLREHGVTRVSLGMQSARTRPAGRRPRPPRRGRPGSSTSAWTSSSAHRVRRTPTGRPRWTPRWRPAPTTSACTA